MARPHAVRLDMRQGDDDRSQKQALSRIDRPDRPQSASRCSSTPASAARVHTTWEHFDPSSPRCLGVHLRWENSTSCNRTHRECILNIQASMWLVGLGWLPQNTVSSECRRPAMLIVASTRRLRGLDRSMPVTSFRRPS